MSRNKLLASAFAASVAINVAFLLIVGNSDIFQHADVLQDLKAQQITVYKPPIPEKPKPKPPKPKVKPPPPPTPKPKLAPPPPIRQAALPKPPPKPQAVKPPARQPAPPRVRPAVSVRPAPTGSHSTRGSVAVPVSSGNVGAPATEVAPPQPAPIVRPAPTPAPQPAPQPVETPAPAPRPTPEVVSPPPPKPRPSIPDRDTPEIIGSFDDLQLPDNVDMSTVTNTTVHAEWDVDAAGQARHVHIQSSGNSDIDDDIRRFIEEHHYKPAVHDGEPMEMHLSHTFTISS